MAGHGSLRALVLSAGLGTRLRPLTHVLPKPLMPVAGQPLVTRTLDALVTAGCEAIALNLHFHAEAIRRQLGTAYRGVPLTYSEEPEILGTLGALAPLREFFREARQVVVVNGDSLCPWPIADLLAEHRSRGAEATLLVSETARAERYGGGVGIDETGRVVALRGLELECPHSFRVFTGAQVLEPGWLEGLEQREQDLVADLYQPLLLRGARLQALSTRRLWHDLGTPQRYLEGVLAWLQESSSEVWISPDAEVSPLAEVRHCAIEAGAVVGPNAYLECSLVLPGARVGAGARIEGSIVGFGATIPSRGILEGQLVMPPYGQPTATTAGEVCSLE